MRSSHSSRLARSLSLLAASALLASQALAGGVTWIVDAAGGAGANFTDIPSAIAAAAPNDAIVIRPGSYASFVLDKPLRMRGAAGVQVQGLSRVQNLPANTRCALTRIEFQRLQIDDCDGGVVLEELTTTPIVAGVGAQVAVSDSDDVRVRACTFSAGGFADPFVAGRNGLSASNAVLEVVSSTLRGQHGNDSFSDPDPNSATRGGVGLSATLSTISIAHSDVRGGEGGGTYSGAGGDGGHASEFSNGSRVRLAASTLVGGPGGVGEDCQCGGFFGDGRNGSAVRATSLSLAVHSGLAATGGYNSATCCSAASTFSTNTGGQILLASPANPTLALHALGAGDVTLRLSAPANSVARVWLGRTMIAPTPQTEIVGQLTHRARIRDLGAMPATGQAQAVFTLPANVESGDLVIAQADVLTTGGVLLYSNSVCFTRP